MFLYCSFSLSPLFHTSSFGTSLVKERRGLCSSAAHLVTSLSLPPGPRQVPRNNFKPFNLV